MPLSFPTSPSDGQVYSPAGVGKSWKWNAANSSWDIVPKTSTITTLGDIVYGGAAGAETRLAGNTSATRTFLGQTGDGTNSAAPSWTSSTGTGNVVLASGPSISNLILTGTLTANASVGSSGQYLESTGTGVRWTSVSGYSAPTIGSTTISSGSTVTTIAGLTLTTPTIDTINTSLTTTGTAALWNTGLTGGINIGQASTGTINIGSGTSTTAVGGSLTIGTTGTITGSTLNINGTNPTIATSQTTGTAAILNTGFTGGINIGQASTGTINIGSGTATVNVAGTITTPTINSTAAGTAMAIANTNTTGNISLGAVLTTGVINIATGTTFSSATGGQSVVNIGTGAHTANTKTINIGGAGTGGTLAINIGSSTGTSTITLNGTVNTASGSFKVGNTTLAQGVTGTITFPASAGTLALNNQTFFIGSTQIAINQGTGTITSLAGVTSVNGTTIPSSATLLTTASTSSALTSFGTSPTITTPTIDIINSASATGTSASLFNNNTTGTISIAPATTTGTINIGGPTAAGTAGTVNILTGTTTSGTKAINIGTNGSTGSTTTIIIGTTTGTTPTVTLRGTVGFGSGGIAGTAGTWHQTATAPTGTTQLNYEGYLYATKVYNAVFNDYAEYFKKEDYTLEPGDVVSLGSDGYVKSKGAYDKLVVGVYSDDYGHCIGGNGDGHDEENFVSVGMAGRVKVKVIGEVFPGDLLVASSIPGVAMTGSEVGAIIGKALESHSGDSIDRIQALILNA